jgi:hypothetical protein
MIYLWQQFGDPLMFAHVQEGFGGGRTTDKLVLLYQVIWRYIKIFFTVDIRNPQYFTIVLEFVSSISFIGIIAYQLFQKVHKSYLLFSILALVLPTLTGTFSSMPRYVLVAFPVFIFFAQLKNNWTRNALLLSFVLLLGLCTILFTRGYWLA